MTNEITGKFTFEQGVDRRGSDSIKWNKYAGRDIIPLWVADMDFAAPQPVLDALHRRVEHGVLGYAAPTPSLVKATLAYLDTNYGWKVEPEWLVWLSGVVTGLNLACRVVDGGVITATPVYPPFLSAPKLSGRELTSVPLKLTDEGWCMDLDAMQAALKADTRLWLLCHPHNPVGRAWSDEELRAFAGFCRRHDLIVCSDEIHCDLILDAERRHLPLACVDDEIARRSITLMAPSKTFNIPGLACAFAVIPDAGLRRRFTGAARGIVPDVNVLGFVAAEAAFREGAEWHRGLIDTLRLNRDRVEAAVAAMPGLAMTHVEATYLAWIDARGLGVDDPVSFFEAAGVGLSNGADFGLPGWVRLNFGCPGATLEAALQRMEQACRQR